MVLTVSRTIIKDPNLGSYIENLAKIASSNRNSCLPIYNCGELMSKYADMYALNNIVVYFDKIIYFCFGAFAVCVNKILNFFYKPPSKNNRNVKINKKKIIRQANEISNMYNHVLQR